MNLFLVLFALALLCSALGFLKFVYFISLGYGLSVAAMGVALLIHGQGHAMAPCVLLVLYGLRLFGYLFIREWKSANYRKLLAREIRDGKGMNPSLKIACWAACALLYVLMVSPVAFRVLSLPDADGYRIAGVFVMCVGMVLEALADAQKTAAKRRNPDRFVDTGLYRIVRCPNYFGEMLFWTGVFVSGIGAVHGVWQWVAVLTGYLGIIYVMFGGARRLEIRQNRSYGKDPEYQAYVKKTPIMIPLIPLYSVEKYKWLVA